MKAVLCKQYGPPATLVMEELPSPRPGAGEVVVSVKAAGVNFPDTLIIQGKYQFRPEPPFSPGAEFAGVVKETGAEVSGFAPGDTVAGLELWGAFREEVVVRADTLSRVPQGVDLAVAAGFGLAYGTSYHALKDRARIQAGETLLVLGAAGGVGLAAIELGKLMGARVIAAASSEEKLATCRRYGADETIAYDREDLREAIKRIAGADGVDVVYDPVGGKYSEAAVRGMAWNGRYLVVGFAAGEIPKIPLNLALLKGCAIVGVFWGEFKRREPALHLANMAQLLVWLGEGRLKPLVSRRYPLHAAAEALDDMLARKVQGKVVLVT